MTLEVKDLNYGEFKNFNIVFKSYRSYSIIGDINCGNETLFRILSTSIMTNNSIFFNDTCLNVDTRFSYLRKIGVIKEVNNNSFILDNVYDELAFSLKKLNLDEEEIKTRIDFYLKYFNLKIKSKKISELNLYEKQLMMVIMALLHEPSIIIMEDIICNLKLEDYIKVNKLFSYFMDKKKLIVIKFFNNFDYVNHDDYIYVMDNYEIIKKGFKDDLMVDDQFLNKHNLRVPFMYDLSLKLKMYKLIDKVYLNMEDMVNDIWK